MRKPQIWLDIEPHPAVYGILRDEAEIVGPLVRPDPSDPLAGIEVADAVLARADFPGTAATFDRARRLRAVARFGAGYDSIDLAAATERGICVMNTPDAPTIATAEFTMTLLLMVSRRVMNGVRAMETDRWPRPSEISGFDLSGRALGIVGLGRIGGRVAMLARAFGMTVSAFDPYLAPERFEELRVNRAQSLKALLAASDVVTLHVPLDNVTTLLIGKAEIAAMRPGAILINASRAAVVDNEALAEVLRDGHLAGAGIDVWSPEPPAADHPLLGLPTVVATPHMSAASVQGRERSNSDAARQVLMVLRGERPPGLLNESVWSRRKVLLEDRVG